MCIRDRYGRVSTFKNNKRTLIETFKRNHNITVSKTLSKAVIKSNTPEVKIHNKISVVALTMDISLTYLFNKQNDKVIDVGIDTTEHVLLVELLYKVAEIHITRTEIVLHTREIRTTSTEEIIDHG